MQRVREQAHGKPEAGGLAALAACLLPEWGVRFFCEVAADRGRVGMPAEVEYAGGFEDDVEIADFTTAGVNDWLEYFDDVVVDLAAGRDSGVAAAQRPAREVRGALSREPAGGE